MDFPEEVEDIEGEDREIDPWADPEDDKEIEGVEGEVEPWTDPLFIQGTGDMLATFLFYVRMIEAFLIYLGWNWAIVFIISIITLTVLVTTIDALQHFETG